MKLHTYEDFWKAWVDWKFAAMHVPVLYMTGRFREDYKVPPPRWYKFAYRDFDTDIYVYGFMWLAYPMRLWNWYRYRRFNLERWLIRKRWIVPNAMNEYIYYNGKRNWHWNLSRKKDG
jgi:hypothetical protein